ncbi:MAG: DUF4403 family protein [Bradyrhizobiaceae bacterium]|nr:MAG: DUF4403 family protein [Bradyrhizobiaceae bacterium]
MNLKSIALGSVIIALSFFASLQAMNYFWPIEIKRLELAPLPPLPPVARQSEIVAPVRISLATVSAALDRATPRNMSGKAPNPAPQLLKNADLDWTVQRGAIATSGAQNTLALSTPLNGTLTVTGSLNTGEGSQIGNALGNILGGNAAKQIGNISIKSLNANAQIQGNLSMTARPEIAPGWRVDPKITAQVDLNDSTLSVAGAKMAVPAQVKPMIDKNVSEQIERFQERLRNDTSFEQTMRREWDKICRSIPLPSSSPGAQGLFIEMRPVRAIAAQPQIDTRNITLTVGLQAETRITGVKTKPDCPFPDKLDIVPTPNTGRVAVAVPIDLPFTEISRVVEAQLRDRTFPEDGNGSVSVRVKRVEIDASGNRLLVSLLVNARERTSWFGLGGDATVRIWGRPVLDEQQQILRLADLDVAVDAGGLMNRAAQAATPYLKKALAEHATVDLKAIAADAQRKLSSIITGFRAMDNGVRVSADVNNLRLGDIAFDSDTLRVIAEATGSIDVTLTALPNF